MAMKTTRAATLCAVILVSGCSFVEDSIFPSNTANGFSEADVTQALADNGEAPQPSLGNTSFEPPGVTNGASTGTFVGQKVVSLRGDLQQLQAALSSQNQALQSIRNNTVQDSQRFHGTLAAISARLQVGTTPGNPILNQQWNAAQGELDRINDDVQLMTKLANEVTSSSAMSAFLLESVRAARQLSGAVDEDHRQLRILEDETNRTVVMIERLLTELSDDILRQQTYTGAERQNLNTLALAIKNGQLYGGSLSGRNSYAPASYAAPAPSPRSMVSQSSLPSEAALVTIRFDKPNVNYEGALYAAVKSAMDRRPDASFDVIAVSPATSTPGQQALNTTNSRHSAEQVMRSLANMGLPAGRVHMDTSTSASARTVEVQVFVR